MTESAPKSVPVAECLQATIPDPSERLLRLPAVIEKCGLEKSAIYAGMKAGNFPKCIKLGQRASAWPESEISRWIAERIRAARRGQQ